MTPTLTDFDALVVNTSGGKDSQAMTDHVCNLADQRRFPRERIVLVHADLGKIEWDGTKELIQEHAEHYGLRLIIVKRNETLLDYARRRGQWPDSARRWCTSDFKRGPGARAITQVVKELKLGRRAKIINCFGFRAQESPARAKREPWSLNKRLTTKTTKEVHDWLPIHTWLEDQVWATIVASGVRSHWAYSRGMTRLSCRFCIFAPRSQLMISACQPENKELFEEYVQLEEEMGHTFKKDQSLREIKDAIDAGEKPNNEDDGSWNM